MSIWIVLAAGPSLNDVNLDLLKKWRQENKVEGVIAVNNAGLDKANWADVLVAGDSAWWIAYPESHNFAGRKFSRLYDRVERFKPPFGAINSGLMAMYIARDIYKAKEIWLFGFDMKGTHYFGQHTRKAGQTKLHNATPNIFTVHIRQFNKFSGCEVYNFNPDSNLKRFPFKNIEDVLL